MNPDARATARTRRRYQRLAPVYDRMEVLSERSFRRWRPRHWEFVRGPKVLEVGVGTGKNMPFYPRQAEITAIDLTPGMLDRARQRAEQLGLDVDLHLGDVQQLTFSDHSFDDAVATFVFCSVPDPMLGLQELARVVKPGGHIVLLEHMRTAQPLLGLLIAPVLMVAYVRLAWREERGMEARFGEAYRVYRTQVPAFWPRLSNRHPGSDEPAQDAAATWSE